MIDSSFIHSDINTPPLWSSFRPGTLLDFRSQDLAEQLTLLDSELFYKIEVKILPVSPIYLTYLSHLTVSHLSVSSNCLTYLSHLSSFQRCCCGLRSRMRRRVRT